jgi:hypothetical protein
MCPHVRRVTPQPYLPIGRARGRGGLFPLGRLDGAVLLSRYENTASGGSSLAGAAIR